MNDPNDAALSALLRQTRSSIPSPTGDFQSRVIRAYERQTPPRSGWRRFMLRTLPIPAPIGAFAAVLLLLIGFAIGLQIRVASTPGGRAERGRVGEHSPTNALERGGEPSRSLGGLQVVAELRPRIIGGEHENR